MVTTSKSFVRFRNTLRDSAEIKFARPSGATTTVLLCSIFPALMLLFKVWKDEAASRGDIEQPPEEGPAQAADEAQEPLLVVPSAQSRRSSQQMSDAKSRRSSGAASEEEEAAALDEDGTPFNTVAKGGRAFKIVAYILLCFTCLMSVTGIVVIGLQQAQVIYRVPPLEKTCAKNWKVLTDEQKDKTDYVLEENPKEAAFLVKLLQESMVQTSGVWGSVCAWNSSEVEQIKKNYAFLLAQLDPSNPNGGGDAASGQLVYEAACNKLPQ